MNGIPLEYTSINDGIILNTNLWTHAKSPLISTNIFTTILLIIDIFRIPILPSNRKEELAMHEHKFRFSTEEDAMDFIDRVNSMGVDWMPHNIYKENGVYWLYFECDDKNFGIIMSIS